jgi:hypothetical protein
MPNASTTDEQKRRQAHAFASAVADGDAATVSLLLAEGARADAALTHGGETPLMRASARGYVDVARVLLDAGADSNAQRADGFTPLILAVFFGHEAVVRLLVEHGADASARTRLGMTAEGWAASRGFAEMAALLRTAEAARPRVEVVSPRSDVNVRSDVSTRADARTSRAKAVTLPFDDEVSIFARKGRRQESRGTVASAFAAMGDRADATGREDKVTTRREDEVTTSREDLTTGREVKVATNREQVKVAINREDEVAADSFASNVSLRRGGQVPAHPSASAFRLGHFLSSWQGSVGTALLLLAFVVAVFAFWRGGTTAREVAQPTPSPLAPQIAAQPLAQITPTPQPSPAFPTPDAQAVMPVTDPAYALPNTAGQPYYVPPVASGPAAPSNASRDLVVVSEGGTPTQEDAGRAKRKTEAGASETTAGSAQVEGRDETSATEDSRANRSTRTPDAEQRSSPPAARPSTPPPAAPAPSATPGRGKVIQWPPQ